MTIRTIWASSASIEVEHVKRCKAVDEIDVHYMAKIS